MSDPIEGFHLRHIRSLDDQLTLADALAAAVEALHDSDHETPASMCHEGACDQARAYRAARQP